MAHSVKCRLCKQKFDTDILKEDEWVLISQKSYYHKRCYEDWKNNRNNPKAKSKDSDFWYETLVDYLYRDKKMSIDFSKLISQWDNFTKPNRGMTPKGVYFSVKYFYDVMNGDITKSEGGIGIVPSIYNKSAEYWVDLESKRSGTIDAIIEQIKTRKNRPIHEIKKIEVPKNKNKWNLEDI